MLDSDTITVPEVVSQSSTPQETAPSLNPVFYHD